MAPKKTAMKLISPVELEILRQRITAGRDAEKPCITVCCGTGCQAYGGAKVAEAFRKEIAERKLETTVEVRTTGCHGFCERGPLIVIKPKNIFYPRA